METKRELIASITDLAGRLVQRFAQEDVDERAHMREMCSPTAQHALERMSVESLHLLDAIPAEGDHQGPTTNIVGLSEATETPKGTVSKRIQRLAELGAVTRHRIPGNRKEVHLRLTLVGQEIQAAHRSLHEHMGAVPGDFLARYSTDDLRVLTRVLDDLVRMPREGVRFRPDLLD